VSPLANSGGWTQLPATSSTGSLPAGRFWHASGVYGDQLFIYGGTVLRGPGAGTTASGDMWAFNIPAARWAPVTQTGAAPGPMQYPAGAFLGNSLFLIGVNSAGGQGLWRWTPGGAAPAPSPTTSIVFQDAGLAAGLSISILVNMASLAFIVMVWRRAGGVVSMKATAASVGPVYEHLEGL